MEIDIWDAISRRLRVTWSVATPPSFGEATELLEDFVSNQKTRQGGGFKYYLFSPLLGEDFQFDEHIFHMGGSTTN